MAIIILLDKSKFDRLFDRLIIFPVKTTHSLKIR